MRSSIFLIVCILGAGCAEKTEWVSIFNGKDLSGWDTYLGPSFDTIQGKRDSIALGLNQDTLHVFSVVELEGVSVLKVSGERYGGISTVSEYKNYHLKLEFKWGTAKWPATSTRKRDSGILYHANGAHGADGGFWMRSQEYQIQEGDCGDYWGCAGGTFDVPAQKNGKGEFVYTTDAPLETFSANSPNGRHCIKNPDAEKAGEWNVVEIYCFGDTTVHVMNGKTCIQLFNCRQTENSKEISLRKGKIQIQSEGSEVFYRSLQIRPIRKIPDVLLTNNP